MTKLCGLLAVLIGFLCFSLGQSLVPRASAQSCSYKVTNITPNPCAASQSSFCPDCSASSATGGRTYTGNQVTTLSNDGADDYFSNWLDCYSSFSCIQSTPKLDHKCGFVVPLKPTCHPNFPTHYCQDWSQGPPGTPAQNFSYILVPCIAG